MNILSIANFLMNTSIQTLINTSIAFCVFIIIWTILGLFVLPHMTGTIGLPALEPKQVWRPVYAVLSKMSEYFAIFLITTFFLLYLIYKVLDAVIPFIYKPMIGWVWSPFKELKSSGIFGLFDAIFGALFSNKSFKDRTAKVANGFKDMFMKGTTFIVNDLVEIGVFPRKNKLPPPKEVPEEPSTAPDTNPNAISDKVRASIEEKYNECLQEKLINITNNMSASTIQAANLNNQYARVQCKLNQFKDSMELLVQRA